MKVTLITLSAFALMSSFVLGGPLAWAACQTACNAGYCVCCTAAGAVAGTFTGGIGIPLALAGCSVIQGTCMAACTPLLIAPTP